MEIAKMLGRKGKPTAMPRNEGTATTGKPCVMLDHPQAGETVTSPQYTFRIGTIGEMDRVEISIQQGAWQPCRNSAGYWWYDWSGYGEGTYQASAKAQSKAGQTIASEPRQFQVALNSDEQPKNT